MENQHENGRVFLVHMCHGRNVWWSSPYWESSSGFFESLLLLGWRPPHYMANWPTFWPWHQSSTCTPWMLLVIIIIHHPYHITVDQWMAFLWLNWEKTWQLITWACGLLVVKTAYGVFHYRYWWSCTSDTVKPGGRGQISQECPREERFTWQIRMEP